MSQEAVLLFHQELGQSLDLRIAVEGFKQLAESRPLHPTTDHQSGDGLAARPADRRGRARVLYTYISQTLAASSPSLCPNLHVFCQSAIPSVGAGAKS